ncbi:MAG: hypothetical protein H6Q91_2581 [Deltaproteobacteria bacterium]|nr:hypothetical protein [Deltaproteobacteria bacterium]
MSDLLPEGENARRAVRWISEQLREQPERPVMALLDQAMLRFDLSPAQCERLVEFYRGAGAKRGA